MEYMLLAIEEAKKTLALGEIPVGAVIVRQGKVIATGYNTRESDADITGHAEINAIRGAAKALNDWRLTDCTIFVTLEPCAMCAGAILQSRMEALVFGAYDTAGGCCGSVYDLAAQGELGTLKIAGGVMEAECLALLQNFFTQKRQ